MYPGAGRAIVGLLVAVVVFGLFAPDLMSVIPPGVVSACVVEPDCRTPRLRIDLADGRRLELSGHDVPHPQRCLPPGTRLEKRPNELGMRVDGGPPRHHEGSTFLIMLIGLVSTGVFTSTCATALRGHWRRWRQRVGARSFVEIASEGIWHFVIPKDPPLPSGPAVLTIGWVALLTTASALWRGLQILELEVAVVTSMAVAATIGAALVDRLWRRPTRTVLRLDRFFFIAEQLPAGTAALRLPLTEVSRFEAAPWTRDERARVWTVFVFTEALPASTLDLHLDEADARALAERLERGLRQLRQPIDYRQ